jgi:hypothetical protein
MMTRSSQMPCGHYYPMSHLRLHQSVDLAQATYTRWADQEGESSDIDGFAGYPSLEDAWYALEELLIWARTLDDRLRREAADKRRYRDQGLIPALADGPRRDAVIEARTRLLSGGVDEAGHLAGLSLHMQSSQAGTKGGAVRSGKIILPFPDRVTSRVSHRWQLTYNEGRDAISFADGLMASVEQFMDEMLTAFETHLPERFKTS